MNASSKDRMKLSLIAIAILLSLVAFGYMLFGNYKDKVAGMYTSGVKIVKVDNAEQINSYKKYGQSYAIKAKTDGKFYLNYYASSESAVSKLLLTNEQFDKLIEDNEYWFNVKFSKPGDTSAGVIKSIYTDNPVRK